MGFPGTKQINPSSELLIYKCDILIPAALENAITLQNVDKNSSKTYM